MMSTGACDYFCQCFFNDFGQNDFEKVNNYENQNTTIHYEDF